MNKVQPPDDINTPDDVMAFNVESAFNRFVSPALEYAASWLNEAGVPYIFMVGIKSMKKINDQNVTYVSGTNNVRSNNLSIVRDFAMCFAHEAIASKNHVQLGKRFAELGCKSPEFMDAFFQHLEDTGHITEVKRAVPLVDPNQSGTVH